MPRVLCGLFVCLMAPLLLSGCGGGSKVKTYAVSGKVTFKRQPLSNAVVTFYPDKGRAAAATTDAQGEFSLSTFQSKDGAPAGHYRVAIGEPAEENIPMPNPGDPEPQAKPPRFPVRYTDPNLSTFTADVKSDSDNKFTFDLTE